MNNSGRAIKLAVKKNNLKSKDILIIHDDIDLDLGKIKIAKNRGAAGHKGIQSIINELGTKDFIRIRIGIKNKKMANRKQKIEDFVLKKFTKEEQEILKGMIKKVVKATNFFLREGLEKTMSEFNK
jgi:PTH1 family peptidyl-tRNA hydrolase